jgi:hypothetical protein
MTPSGPYLPPRQTSPRRPEQLPMFMSARDIMTNYQPLEGDRSLAYDPREGETTARPYTTAGQPNPRLTTRDVATGYGWAHHVMNTGDTHYRSNEQEETDEQVWDRKLDESKLTLADYHETHSGGFYGKNRTPGWNTIMERSSAPSAEYKTGHTDTFDDRQLDQADYVQRHQEAHWMARDENENDSLHGMLSRAMEPGGEGFTGHVRLGQQFGPSGKRMIAGAHHRIAIMNDIQPDRLLPVLHTQSVAEAKKGREAAVYPYD